MNVEDLEEGIYFSFGKEIEKISSASMEDLFSVEHATLYEVANGHLFKFVLRKEDRPSVNL